MSLTSIQTNHSFLQTTKGTIGLLKEHRFEILTGTLVGTAAAIAFAAAIFFTGGSVLAIALAAGLFCVSSGVSTTYLLVSYKEDQKKIRDLRSQITRSSEQANSLPQEPTRLDRRKKIQIVCGIVGLITAAAIFMRLLQDPPSSKLPKLLNLESCFEQSWDCIHLSKDSACMSCVNTLKNCISEKLDGLAQFSFFNEPCNSTNFFS